MGQWLWSKNGSDDGLLQFEEVRSGKNNILSSKTIILFNFYPKTYHPQKHITQKPITHITLEVIDATLTANVAKHVKTVSPMTHVPMTSVKGMTLSLKRLSFAENAKYGELEGGLQHTSSRLISPSFLEAGYEDHREPLEVKFEMSTVEPEKGLYEIKPFSVGYIDGQNKAIIMLSVIAMIAEAGPLKTILW